MVMPGGVTGRALAEQLQERNPLLKVLFTSGYSAEFAGQDLPGHAGALLLQEGLNFLQKPCTPERLLEALRSRLDDGLRLRS